MPRQRLRTKTLSPTRRKTCGHGERVSLELKSPVVQPKASRRASEAVPAPTRFERMEATTLRCEGTSGNELDEGDEWAVLATCGIRPPVEAFENTQSRLLLLSMFSENVVISVQ
jgi:hypothetical protein